MAGMLPVGRGHLMALAPAFIVVYRLEARQIVAESLNARIRDKDEHGDVVIFTGMIRLACVAHGCALGTRYFLLFHSTEDRFSGSSWQARDGGGISGRLANGS